MAKLEHTLNGNFNQWLSRIEDGILNGSMSASLEESSDFRSGDARCSVRVFERYSYAGGNRVSLSVMTKERWQTVELFRRQKTLLDTFLEKNAITNAQYDKSLGDLREKMGMHGVN